MTTETKINSWIQFKSRDTAKWHRATVEEPTYFVRLADGRVNHDHKETSACGLTFRPNNVEHNRFPYPPEIPAHIVRNYVCQHCA